MRRLLLSLALALAGGAAQADDGLLYLGAGIANDDIKDVAATNSDLISTNWRVCAGVRPISLFAVEADYVDLGGRTVTSPFIPPSTTHIKYQAFAGYAVGFAPIPLPYLDVFGKVGLARWTLSGDQTPPFPGPGLISLSDRGTQFAWGAGVQAHVGDVGARLEYEHFGIRNTDGANLISLSVFLNLF